jgi:hypothetical protein
LNLKNRLLLRTQGLTLSKFGQARWMMENRVLAEIAYHAYGNWMEWKTPQGYQMRGWGELSMNVKNAWTAAVETVALQVRKDELNRPETSNVS